MSTVRKWTALAAALLLLGSLCAAVFAHDVPDLTRDDCSIHLTLTHRAQNIPGGSITLYRVADVYESDGDYTFRLTQEFAGTKLDPELLRLDRADYDAELAKTLADYAAAHPKITGRTERIDKNGEVTFDKLTPGLYLLTDYSAYTGYTYTANPFLVSVPMLTDGVYVYSVDATPKIDIDRKGPVYDREPEPEPEPGREPKDDKTPGGSSSTGGSGYRPSGTTLPKTGQVNWPVPVLAILGLCAFSAGWLLRFGKRGRDET